MGGLAEAGESVGQVSPPHTASRNDVHERLQQPACHPRHQSTSITAREQPAAAPCRAQGLNAGSPEPRDRGQARCAHSSFRHAAAPFSSRNRTQVCRRWETAAAIKDGENCSGLQEQEQLQQQGVARVALQH